MISGYLARKTWLHAVPAGAKLASLAALSLALLPVTDLRVLAGGLATVLALYASLGREALFRLGSLRPLLPMLLVIGVLQGAVGNWQAGAEAALRLVLMVLAADLLTLSTTMQALMDALAPVLRPLSFVGLNAKKLTVAVALVVRFVPVLLASWQARAEAWRARTGRRVSVRLVAPFVAETLRLADQVGEALDARGFDAKR
jgi:biotin transport system permease protein